MKQIKYPKERIELRVSRKQIDQYDEMLRKPYNWKKWLLFKYYFKDQVEENLDQAVYSEI